MNPERRAALEQDLAELNERRREVWVDIITGHNLRTMDQLGRIGVRRRWLLEQIMNPEKGRE